MAKFTRSGKLWTGLWKAICRQTNCDQCLVPVFVLVALGTFPELKLELELVELTTIFPLSSRFTF
jgi:hypothetical protein